MMVYAPWTDQQVSNLQKYQDGDIFHPYTGIDSAGRKVNLIPTKNGWIAEPDGLVVQNWALEFTMRPPQ